MFNFDKFKENIESVHTFPCEYMFKFVANENNVIELKNLIENENYIEKKSSKGNFRSFSFKKNVTNSDEIINIYVKASKIDGIIAL